MIKDLVNLLRELWCALFFNDVEEIEFYDIIPAIEWDAVFASVDDGITTRPVIFWQVTYCDDCSPLEAVGMVFIDNKPPYVEQAAESPHFIGYQRVSSESKPSSLTLAYRTFNEWS